MTLKFVFVLIMILLASGVVDARMPKVGDEVAITTDSMWWAKGEITDMGDGLICLYATSSYGINSPGDVCIGVGSIVELYWT